MDEGKKRKDDVTIYTTTQIIVHKWMSGNRKPEENCTQSLPLLKTYLKSKAWVMHFLKTCIYMVRKPKPIF